MSHTGVVVHGGEVGLEKGTYRRPDPCTLDCIWMVCSEVMSSCLASSSRFKFAMLEVWSLICA